MRILFSIVVFGAMIISAGCGKKPGDQTQKQEATGSSTTASNSVSSPSPNPTPAAEAPPPRPEPPAPLVVPAGTVITVRLSQALGSKTSHTGDSFTATVASPIAVNGKLVIPTSSSAEGTVVDAQERGKIKGAGLLQLALNEITVEGTRYPIETRVFSSEEKGKGKRTAATTGGGGVIGGIVGGGKGAVIGAAAGLAGGALTGNKQIELPAESAVSFTLKTALTLE